MPVLYTLLVDYAAVINTHCTNVSYFISVAAQGVIDNI